MKCFKLLLVALLGLVPSVAFAQSAGHSVNDQLLEDPLEEALASGVHSVDLDVFYLNGQLKACPPSDYTACVGAFNALYLDPLLSLDEQDRPELFRIELDVRVTSPQFRWQTIANAYAAAKTAMADRPDLQDWVEITFVGSNQNYPPPSGNPDYLKFAADPNYYMTIVGWPYTWDGTGEMPATELADLQARVSSAHGAGKLIRFSPHTHEATGDVEAIWDLLDAEGVDYTGTLDPSWFAGLDEE